LPPAIGPRWRSSEWLLPPLFGGLRWPPRLGLPCWPDRLPPVAAHCDTLAGPVVADARRALAIRDVTPALKWVSPSPEGAVRTAFAAALRERARGNAARRAANMRFLAVSVKLHRQGEGEPFTGLKPAGAQVDPALVVADKALASGSPDPVVRHVTADAAAGIRSRYAKAAAARKQAGRSVAAGRKYVRAYVEYVHYVERVHATAARSGAQHSEDH